MSRDDHYAILGLTRSVGGAEIRRAYRLLALRHHPDRAGPDGTAKFQRIAEAYRVLSDPALRSTYDTMYEGWRPEAPPRPVETPASPVASAVASKRRESRASLIARLCGTLVALQSRQVVRVHASGLIDLLVTADEARAGGVAAISLPLTISCPTCGGIAGPATVWCRRCQFEGSVVEEVTLCLPIPEHAPDGMAFNLEMERLGDLPPMVVRIRVV
jgi:DnaJ-class molecular chaperone